MSRLRLAFMGTPDFAVTALRSLHKAGHEIAIVYCQPPKPAGRGYHLRAAPVQEAAEAYGLQVRHPKSLRQQEEQQFFSDLKLDIAVVAAYGLILPKAILAAPKWGCLNIHGSLLPRWRGAAPIQRALLSGDKETGITIMQMDEGLDTGAMLVKAVIPITDESTAASLHDALALKGAELVTKALDDLARGSLKATPQPSEGITYAAKLTKDDGRIDWQRSAQFIDRQLRALNPWPGTSFNFNGEAVKLLDAKIIKHGEGEPGTLLDEAFTVACGEDALRLEKVQRGGKAPIDGAAFLRGQRVTPGFKL